MNSMSSSSLSSTAAARRPARGGASASSSTDNASDASSSSPEYPVETSPSCSVHRCHQQVTARTMRSAACCMRRACARPAPRGRSARSTRVVPHAASTPISMSCRRVRSCCTNTGSAPNASAAARAGCRSNVWRSSAVRSRTMRIVARTVKPTSAGTTRTPSPTRKRRSTGITVPAGTTYNPMPRAQSSSHSASCNSKQGSVSHGPPPTSVSCNAHASASASSTTSIRPTRAATSSDAGTAPSSPNAVARSTASSARPVERKCVTSSSAVLKASMPCWSAIARDCGISMTPSSTTTLR